MRSSRRRLLHQSARRRVLDRIESPPRSSHVVHFGLVERDDRLGQRVVVRVADAADRGLDAGRGEPLGVTARHVLTTAVAVMDQPLAGPAGVQRLLERIEHRIGVHRTAHAPAGDPAGEHIDDDGHVDEAHPGGDIRDVGDPQLVRPCGLELPPDAIERALGEVRRDRGAADKKTLLMAGVWTIVCVMFPALDAQTAGFKVYAVMDASASGFTDRVQVATAFIKTHSAPTLNMRLTDAGLAVGVLK